MPIYLAVMPDQGATVVNGLNAALVHAEDTTLALAQLNQYYPGGASNPWSNVRFVEISQANLPQPMFLAAPIQPGGSAGSVET
jgi:hypothetical protein